MKTAIYNYNNHVWTMHESSVLENDASAALVLCFAAKDILATPGIYEKVKRKFPAAQIAMCSTAGEIYHNTVNDDTMVTVAMQFDKSTVNAVSVNTCDYSNSYDAAMALVKKLPTEDLSYIMVLSDGSNVNGSELAKGLNEAAGNNILITGGLAGDATNFKSTLVGLNGQPEEGKIVAIGFYGKNMVVSHGSKGGWDIFGLEREVTSSTENVLFELDGGNALELYKKYLGDDAQHLPGSALLFPLSVIVPGATQPVVRTILSIDEDKKSMTFAGDIPAGSKVRLMKANFDKITTAAYSAAQNSILSDSRKPDFSLLVSCVGRKIILGSRTEEEVEAVNESLGDQTLLAGFYSYGEISPFNEGGHCQLHNQTMTITSFYEL